MMKTRQYDKEYYLKNRDKVKERHNKYRLENPDKIKQICKKSRLKNREQTRERHLKYNFNLTIDQYNDMLIRQNDVCAICGEKETSINSRTKEIRRLSIDHNHLTGKVRGLLCHACNTGIGKLKDNPQLLRNAVNYLEIEDENQESFTNPASILQIEDNPDDPDEGGKK